MNDLIDLGLYSFFSAFTLLICFVLRRLVGFVLLADWPFLDRRSLNSHGRHRFTLSRHTVQRVFYFDRQCHRHLWKFIALYVIHLEKPFNLRWVA